MVKHLSESMTNTLLDAAENEIRILDQLLPLYHTGIIGKSPLIARLTIADSFLSVLRYALDSKGNKITRRGSRMWSIVMEESLRRMKEQSDD